MCHFITATLPKNAPQGELDAIARKSGRQFQNLASPAVAAQLPQGSAYFLTTLAHCDCGTAFGSARSLTDRSSDWAAEESKLLKKGWSPAKVARALRQKRDDEEAKHDERRRTDAENAKSLASFISSILLSGLTSEIGLLLHNYRGPLDESFSILRHEVVPATADLAAMLPAAEEDVLYVFRTGA